MTKTAESYIHKWKKLIHGTALVFFGEALAFPTGLVIVIFLTRRLGPEHYGLFVLVSTLINWVEWSMQSIFSRSVVKLIGETKDWRPVAAQIVKVNFTFGVCAAGLLWIAAEGIGVLFKEPAIAGYARLFALEIPLFCLGRAYRSIMVGAGYFSQRALCTAVHFIGRLFLIVLFVQLGFSIPGVIAAHILAALLDLVVIHFFCVPSLLFSPSRGSLRQLLFDSIPLFMFAISMRFYSKMDLFMLKILGGTKDQAGFYSVAQSLSQGLGIFALSFSPILIAGLSHALRTQDMSSAKRMARQAMRLTLLWLPWITLASSSAKGFIPIIFSETFVPAASIFSLLIFGAWGLLMISVTTAILTSAAKPGWTLALAAPMVCLAGLGHWALIPRLGTQGACLVTTFFALAGALASALAVYKIWEIFLPWSTLWKSVFISALIYGLSFLWPVSGSFVFIKMLLLSIVIVLAYWRLGEFGPSETHLIRSLFQRRGEVPDIEGTES